MKYDSGQIATIIKGRFLCRGRETVIGHLLLDSRRLIYPDSSLFFALPGPRRNGHAFLPTLYERGVRNFVVSETVDTDLFPGANIIAVKDTLAALQLLTAHHRKQFSIPVVAITGSNGKTIVKEWLNQLLEDHYRIVRSPKSYNSQIGVPLSVWAMQEAHELAIFEAGISRTGEMQNLEKIIRPTIGIFTNIGEAHNEGFLNQRQKINEKLCLFAHVNTLIYCRDYPDVHEAVAVLWQQLHKAGGETPVLFNWSAVAEATLQILNILKEEDSALITAAYQGQTLQTRIPFTDDASIENAIHCWCVLLHLGVPAEAIPAKMMQLTHVAMRLELKHGINNCSIINDSYSADLNSLRIALDFLSKQQQHPVKTVILSDILQSGKSEMELYEEIAGALRQRKINRFIGIGERLYQHQALFRDHGNWETLFFPSVEHFRQEFPRLSFREETILLKGARVFGFEEIGRLLEQAVHQTVLEIDLNALAHNLRLYQQSLHPATRLMVMVKAFSYGSGSYEIANMLQFHKVDYLAVAYTDEGVALRKAGITLPVMVMNADASTFDALLQNNLEPELYSLSQVKALEVFLKKEGILQFPVHIELETGMNRLGFAASDLPELLEHLKGPPFKVQTVFSHLVASEDPQHDAFSRQQFDLFMQMCDRIAAVLPYPFLRHIDNSAGITRHPDFQLDMVRLGIGLYGISGDAGHPAGLEEVSTLRTTIAQVKTLKEGETVSYGRNGLLTRDSRIATVRIGYADGYPRSLSNGAGKMWVNGHLAPVVGNICMDMTMIDITDMPRVTEEEEVIVFGKELPVKWVAQWAGTIPYEILTGVSQRVKRIYFEE